MKFTIAVVRGEKWLTTVQLLLKYFSYAWINKFYASLCEWSLTFNDRFSPEINAVNVQS